MGLTKQKKTNSKQSVGVVLTTEQQTAFATLTSIGVTEGVARELAQTCELELIEAWVRYARKAGSLTDEAAFVVKKLKTGEKPPVKRPKTEEEKRAERYARYVGGKYANLVQH